jgi:hypothetical protein
MQAPIQNNGFDALSSMVHLNHFVVNICQNTMYTDISIPEMEHKDIHRILQEMRKNRGYIADISPKRFPGRQVCLNILEVGYVACLSTKFLGQQVPILFSMGFTHKSAAEETLPLLLKNYQYSQAETDHVLSQLPDGPLITDFFFRSLHWKPSRFVAVAYRCFKLPLAAGPVISPSTSVGRFFTKGHRSHKPNN